MVRPVELGRTVSDRSLPVLGALVVAGLLTGWVDAVVGGGGLIQLPALLLGLPDASPAAILATNKVGAVVGTTMSAATYVRRVPLEVRTVLPTALVAAAGSVLGALWSSHLSRATMTPIVVVMLIAVGTFVLLRPDLGSVHGPRHAPARRTLVAAGLGLLVGGYDGALGPGTGSFLVFGLVALVGYGFLQASATAKVVNVATNLGALVVFLPHAVVVWPAAAALASGNLVGGYVGARTAVARGNGFVRAVFVVVVTLFVIRLGGTVVGLW